MTGRNKNQNAALEEAYRKTCFPTREECMALGQTLKLSLTNTQKWFARRRKKDGFRLCRKCFNKIQAGKKPFTKTCGCNDKIDLKEPNKKPVIKETKPSISGNDICRKMKPTSKGNDSRREAVLANDPRMNPFVVLQRIHLMCGAPLCRRCFGVPSH